MNERSARVESSGPHVGRNKLILALIVGSGLLLLPASYAAVLGFMLVVPVLLWIAGVSLLIGYINAFRGGSVGPRFWDLSLLYNCLGSAAWLYLLLVSLLDIDLSWGSAGMLAWCSLAGWLSHRLGRMSVGVSA